MKKHIKTILILLIIILISIIIFFIFQKVSLNNYLNNTIEYSNKINYTTNINLNIKDSNNNSKINYEIVRSSYINKITIENYINNTLTSNIDKYIITKGDKKGSYVYDNEEYKKLDEIKEEFNVNYQNLKNNIKFIKKSSNEIINGVNYKKYIVKMKSYDAYNLIYENQILTKKDSDKYIDVEIYIDKTNNFVYKISYKINNLNNRNDNSSINYDVEIINKDINNTNDIKLPF